MPFFFNPFTSNLDFFKSTDGFVVGPASATDEAIARYDGTTGELIQNSLTRLQDGGAIQAQGFITKRKVTDLVQVPNDYTWLAPNIEIELSGSVELEIDGEIVIL